MIKNMSSGFSDRTQPKPGCTPTEHEFEISELGSRRIVLYIEFKFVATVQLICVVVFVYAKSRFSHDAAKRYMVY